NDDDLELQIYFRSARGLGCVFIALLCAAHGDLRRNFNISRFGRARRRPAQTSFNAAVSTGGLRKRLPVAAKIALVSAGTIAEVPASPIPPGGSALFTM